MTDTPPAAAPFGELVAPGFRYAFEGTLVHREESPFQLLEVYDNAFFGRMLILDGLTQTTERDEFLYHEMLVHPGLIIHPDPRRVLIIGGGDGGTLRRVLQHPSVERVVMVEIDERVTRVCRDLMPSIAAGAFEDPRSDVRFEDGAAFVHQTDERFDAVIVDSSDPVGPGVVLFRDPFYSDVRRCLAPEGVFVQQSGGPILQSKELRETFLAASAGFGSARLYLGTVPTYPGCAWSFLLAGGDDDPDDAAVRRRAAERGLRTRYWTPDVHRAAFALPAYVERIVALDGSADWALDDASIPRR